MNPWAAPRRSSRRLRDRVKLGVVSNHPDPGLVIDSLASTGLRGALDTIVISGAIGWMKPDVPPFRRALRDLGTDRARTLFVGDTPETDVVGAQAAGMPAAWLGAPDLAPPPGIQPEDRLHQLAGCHGDRRRALNDCAVNAAYPAEQQRGEAIGGWAAREP